MSDPRPADEPRTPHTASPEVVRSEEELLVTTELVETGRARLVKRVEVETVTRTIELRREILEVEQLDPGPAATDEAGQPGATLPPGDAEPGGPGIGLFSPGSFQSGAVEIVLMQEEAIISTQLVPRERVRLSKQIVTEPRMVDADLKAEHVDLEQRRPPGNV